MFYLNSIFSWFWSFFFCNDCWIMYQHQIHYIKNVIQISRKWNRKKFIDQKSCFVFQKCYQFFIKFFLRVFKLMWTFSTIHLKPDFWFWFIWLKITISFYSRHLYQLFFEISKILFCVWFFVCNHLRENKFFNFFNFVN